MTVESILKDLLEDEEEADDDDEDAILTNLKTCSENFCERNENRYEKNGIDTKHDSKRNSHYDF